MKKLYVLYDPNCALCQRLKEWLLAQRSWMELCLIPAGSEEARHMFPTLQQIASANDLVVVSDEGQVYFNNNAWIMTLYALVEFREWACRLSHPMLLPLVRQAFATISRNRYAISRWISAGGPEQIAGELRHVALEPCAAPHPTISDYLR
jgi:predicted DCC family thiol-disulfide oxidoreductase YuxK